MARGERRPRQGEEEGPLRRRESAGPAARASQPLPGWTSWPSSGDWSNPIPGLDAAAINKQEPEALPPVPIPALLAGALATGGEQAPTPDRMSASGLARPGLGFCWAPSSWKQVAGPPAGPQVGRQLSPLPEQTRDARRGESGAAQVTGWQGLCYAAGASHCGDDGDAALSPGPPSSSPR